jgi:hypothetical protein
VRELARAVRENGLWGDGLVHSPFFVLVSYQAEDGDHFGFSDFTYII